MKIKLQSKQLSVLYFPKKSIVTPVSKWGISKSFSHFVEVILVFEHYFQATLYVIHWANVFSREICIKAYRNEGRFLSGPTSLERGDKVSTEPVEASRFDPPSSASPPFTDINEWHSEDEVLLQLQLGLRVKLKQILRLKLENMWSNKCTSLWLISSFWFLLL